MRNYKYLSPFALVLIATLSYTQVPIHGSLILGDTTQQHQLTTTQGDIFTGRVIGFEQAFIKFLYRNSTLSFTPEEVKMIKVLSSDPVSPDNYSDTTKQAPAANPSPPDSYDYFDYKFVDTDGKESVGQLIKIKEGKVMVKRRNRDLNVIDLKDIREIVLLGDSITTSRWYDLDDFHRLLTKRGDRFTGQVLHLREGKLTFLLVNGSVITLDEADFVSILLEEKAPRENALPPEEVYHQQRFFFTPTAHLLKKGVREFRSMLLHNTIETGVSDNVTVGAGLFSVLVGNLISAKLKFGASLSPYVHVAAGGQVGYGFTFLDDYDFKIGLYYMALAVGTRDNFINVSLGRGRSNEDRGGTTVFSLGGSIRLGQHWRVFDEYIQFREPYFSYYYNDNAISNTFGFSWFKDQHQIDFGVFVSNLDEVEAGFPIVAYQYKF